MFKIIDNLGRVYDAYGTFVDSDGDIQFILCDVCGHFFKIDVRPGTYRLYTED